MLSAGPFPATVVVVVLALAAAFAAGALAARGRPGAVRSLAGLIADMTLIGVLAARLGFVLAWWPKYMAAPWSIIYIGDGGYMIQVGALASTAFVAWRVRGRPALWRPLATAVIAGWAVWIMAGAALTLAQRTHAGMPEATLARLDGGSVTLSQLTTEPMVVNLWATWCPPCRREMPMLAAAQRHHPGVTFVFVNQRQGAAAVRDYLDDERLRLNHVLLDTRGAVARSIGSHALPTTLFYDADGRLVDTHVGMLTAASLAATLQRLGLSPNPPGDDPR